MSEKTRYYRDDIAVIKPKGYVKTPLDCPVCGNALSSHEDVCSYEKNGCCEECDLLYRYPNKKKWEEGWRPSEKDLIKNIITSTEQEK